MAYAGTGYATNVEYGGFWIRVVAAIIDGIILGIVQFILNLVIDDFAARNLINTVVG